MFEPTGPTDVDRMTAPFPPPPVVETRLAGRFEFEGGYPTPDSLHAFTTCWISSVRARCSFVT